MIRFAVIFYFFVHLAVMVKTPHLKWASRFVGYGISALFIALVVFSYEPNSNIVFMISAFLAALGVFAADMAALVLKRKS